MVGVTGSHPEGEGIGIETDRVGSARRLAEKWHGGQRRTVGKKQAPGNAALVAESTIEIGKKIHGIG